MSDPDLPIKPPTTVAVVQESVGADPRVRPIAEAPLVAPTPADPAAGGVVDPGQQGDAFIAATATDRKSDGVPALLKTNLQWQTLMAIVTAETSTADSGYPIISRAGFRLFEDQVSHLFHEGQVVLDWLAQLKNLHPLPRWEGDGGGWPPRDSILRAIKVLRTVILTASITAPTDLWLTRQILATHQRLGILEYLKDGATLVVANVAKEKNLVAAQLDHDLQFLHARGYLDRTGDGYVLAKDEAGAVVANAAKLTQFAADWHIDWAAEMIAYFGQGLDEARTARLEAWLEQRIQEPSATPGWIANLKEIEIGYKLVPLVIALKASGLLENLKSPSPFPLPSMEGVKRELTPGMQRVLENAGLIRGGQVTELGAKVFADGSGPFGIIYAYNTYLNQHEALLNNSGERPWVQRGPNIVASRDANKATFQKAIQALGRFMQDESWSPEVMVEHALGLGVAIQTFVEKFGTEGYHFVGADYEEAALAGARREQAEGRLPEEMQFLQADIGDPDRLVNFLKARGLPTTSAVMVVGAGFHEVRNKTDEQMIEVFRKYCEAGIILIFAETSDLTDEQLRDTGWQTYHAGFRWAHLTSGQNLRIPWPMEGTSGCKSWLEIAEAAGYTILDDYSPKKRPIYPRSLVPENNPPLEVTFFAVPDNHPTLGSRLEPRIQKATATPASGGLVSQQPLATEGLTLDFVPHKNATHTPKLLPLEDAQKNPHVVVFERRSVADARQILMAQNYPDLAEFDKYPAFFKGFVYHGHTVFLARNLRGEVLGYSLVTFDTDDNPGSVKAHRIHKKEQKPATELKGLGLALMAYMFEDWWKGWSHLQPQQGVIHAILPQILQDFRSRTFDGRTSPIPHAFHDEWDPGRKYPRGWIPKEEAEFVRSLFHFTPVTPVATLKSKQRIHPLPRGEGVGGGCHLATSATVFSGEVLVMGAGPVVEKAQALAEPVATGSTEDATQSAGGGDVIADQTSLDTDDVLGPGFLGWRTASRAVAKGFVRALR